MNNLKNYSKPLMISEKFVPNSYCVICDPKTEVSYTLSDPYPSWQHFVLDYNDNGVLDESDLPHTQTTDNSNPAPDHLTVNDRPSICWPCDGKPATMDNTHEDVPLWYVINLYNHSGHVYGYQSMVINDNHS